MKPSDFFPVVTDRNRHAIYHTDLGGTIEFLESFSPDKPLFCRCGFDYFIFYFRIKLKASISRRRRDVEKLMGKVFSL
jgi:hypothetical protein